MAGLLLTFLMVCVLVPASDPVVAGVPRADFDDHLRSVEAESACQAAWEREHGLFKQLARPWRSSIGLWETVHEELESLRPYADAAEEARAGQPLLLRRAIALGELGRYEDIRDEVESHAGELPPWAPDALRSAYGRDLGGADAAPAMPGWFGAVLAGTVARRSGDEAAEADAARTRLAIEDAAAGRARAPLATQILLALAGLLVLLAWLARDRPDASSGRALPEACRPRDSWAVLVRALLVYIVVGATCVWAGIATVWAPLAASGYAWRGARKHVALRAAGAPDLGLLGWSAPSNWTRFALAAVCGTGLLVLCDLGALRLQEALDGAPGAVQRLRPGLSRMTDAQLVQLALEAAVLGPLFAEFALRGLLYCGLRALRGPLWSFSVCALFQGALYGATPLGFLSATLSAGAACALYERTRSLWPGIVAAAGSSAASLWAQAALAR